MADPLRVVSTGQTSREVSRSAPDGQRRERRERDPARPRTPHAGGEELAVALHEEGRSALAARFEQDEDGEPRIRIVDPESGETVAVLSPDELRALAEQTGLPPGLLIQAAS